MAVALVTGASRGLGLALARALAERGWQLVIDARDPTALETARAELAELARHTSVLAVAGDVSDPDHRRQLRDAVRRLGGLDLLVNNASVLGPSPQPPVADYPPGELERVYRANVFAPAALVADLLPLLGHGGRGTRGTVVNVTSDAAVEPYPGWSGYGSSKAALDQLTAILAAERTDMRVYAFDPGDMRTALQQEAFPDEDIADRPAPDEVALPRLLRLLDDDLPSGRYRAEELVAATAPVSLPAAR